MEYGVKVFDGLSLRQKRVEFSTEIFIKPKICHLSNNGWFNYNYSLLTFLLSFFQSSPRTCICTKAKLGVSGESSLLRQ